MDYKKIILAFLVGAPLSIVLRFAQLWFTFETDTGFFKHKFEAIGRISSEVVALCPPGISILLPGEIIKKEHLPYLFSYDKLEVIRE